MGSVDDEETKPLAVQDRKKSQNLDAGRDEELMICDQNAVTITASDAQGYGMWQTLEGGGVITPAGQEIKITALNPGINNFKYSVTYCDATDARVVKINRIITPASPTVQSLYTYCDNQLAYAEISLSGNDLRWYSDAALLEEIKKGNKFYPETTDVVYVTDQIETCRSNPAAVKIVVSPSPLAPGSLAAETCVNTPVDLNASGTGIKWYSSPEAPQPSHVGNNINQSFNAPGSYTLYITSTVNGCESARTPVTVKIKGFALEDMFIPNIITPNGDPSNEYFELPEVNFRSCAGNFKRVVIFNRFGKTLFTSTDQGFRWAAADVPDGMYFYVLSFDAYKFEGSISVRR